MRTLAILLLTLVVPNLARAEPSTCPVSNRIRFNPDAWVKKLRATSDPQQLQNLLTAAGLDPISLECDREDRRPWFTAVSAFRAPIDTEGREVRAVNVLGALCEDKPDDMTHAAPEFQRGAIYVATGEGEWCKLDAPFLNAQGSAYGPQLCSPTVFGVDTLVSEDRKTLRVVEKQEWCGGAGSARGDKESLAYYEVRGWTLHPLVRLQIFDGAYHSAAGVGWSTQSRVRITGKPPKTIEVSTEKSCLPAADGLPADPSILEAYACTPSKSRSIWRHRGDRYQEERVAP